jgi:tetratricopeptide (TPR) repeat protein
MAPAATIQPSSELWKRAKFEIGHVWYELARQRRAEGQTEPARAAFREARRELEQALAYYPEEARPGILALDTLAQIAVDEDDWDKALAHLRRLLALGDATDAEGNAVKLEEPYASVCDLALVRRADCEFRLNRLQEAADLYLEAYKQVMTKAVALDCLHRRAVCQMRLGFTADAADTLSRARAALDRLAGAGEIDAERRAAWQALFNQGTAGLLTWKG